MQFRVLSHRIALYVPVALIICVVAAHDVAAVLIVNPSQPITHEIRVQPIIASNDDGSDTAEFFGNSSQMAEIEGFIDTIWSQAGIDVTFLSPNTINDTFVNNGTPGNNNPRPTSDLSAIVAAGDSAGVTHPNSSVINIFFVEIAAGFSQLSDNSVAGLAFVGGNGISQFVGDNLPTFLAGREAVASVVAHEIGHNVGLQHIVEAENLMQASGASNQGERLNSSQITTALNSPFAVLIPEPASYALAIAGLALAAVVAGLRRRT